MLKLIFWNFEFSKENSYFERVRMVRMVRMVRSLADRTFQLCFEPMCGRHARCTDRAPRLNAHNWLRIDVRPDRCGSSSDTLAVPGIFHSKHTTRTREGVGVFLQASNQPAIFYISILWLFPIQFFGLFPTELPKDTRCSGPAPFARGRPAGRPAASQERGLAGGRCSRRPAGWAAPLRPSSCRPILALTLFIAR